MPIIASHEDIRSLLLRARTIAVVGLSDDPGRDSSRVAAYLLRAGFTVLPVNPSIHTVLGLQVVASLSDLHVPVDIVDIFRRPSFVPAIVHDAVAIGAATVWMQPGTRNDEAAALASSAGLNVVVDRCIMADHRRLFS